MDQEGGQQPKPTIRPCIGRKWKLFGSLPYIECQSSGHAVDQRSTRDQYFTRHQTETRVLHVPNDIQLLHVRQHNGTKCVLLFHQCRSNFADIGHSLANQWNYKLAKVDQSHCLHRRIRMYISIMVLPSRVRDGNFSTYGQGGFSRNFQEPYGLRLTGKYII